MSKPKEYDLNFLRFLTLHIPNGLEDSMISGLLKPVILSQIEGSIKKYIKNRHSSHDKFGLYIYIPYCERICTYCHCLRIKLSNRKELSDYVDFISKQIYEFSPMFNEVRPQFLQILGGTASLLSSNNITRIFDEVFQKFNFEDNCEVNFEGKPSSLSLNKLKTLKNCGVKRLSIGIQSLDPKVLKEINRNQSEHEVFQCIENIKRLGFPCLDVDLVAGLPHQTVESFLNDIKIVVSIKPEIIHINPYSDIFESVYYKSKSIHVKEFIKRRHTMILEAKKILRDNGYERAGFAAYRLNQKTSLKTSGPACLRSVLGLGAFGRSNLAGQLVFENISQGENLTSCHFSGFKINKRYTMAQYIILHLLKGLRKIDFCTIFQEDFDQLFKKEIYLLKELRLIKEHEGTYRYSMPWTVEGMLEYFSLTKIFFGEEFILLLKNNLKRDYNPSRDYRSRKHLVNIFQDLWIMRTYYDLGYKSCWL